MPKHDAVHPKLTENDIEGQLQLGKKINQAGEGGPPTTACGPHGDGQNQGRAPRQPQCPHSQGARRPSAGEGRQRTEAVTSGWEGWGRLAPAPGSQPRPATCCLRPGAENRTSRCPVAPPGRWTRVLRAPRQGEARGYPGRGRPEDTQAGGGPRMARTKGCEAFRKAAGSRGSPVPGSERMRAWTAARPGSPAPCAAPSLPASLLAPPPSFSTGLLFSPIALAGFSSSSYFPP